MPLGWALLAYLALVNVVTLVAYARDKRAARAGTRRIRERTLHELDLAGGFIGGWLGMRLLRHKTLHRSFLVVQALAAVAWVGLVILLLRSGRLP